jgi:hypothetical protein
VSVAVVDRQLEAYNSHDLESFLACYSRDVTIRDRHGEVLMSGVDAVRGEYADWFAAHPDVRAEVTSRLVSGALVVDEELITMTGSVISALVCYHVADGVIDAVLLLSEAT